MKSLKLYSFILLLLVSASVFGASVKISVSGPRGKQSIAVGEQFYISIHVNDIEAAPATPKDVPGAKVMYFDRTGSSSSFSSVNGKTSQTCSYEYTATCRALKEGSYSFGPISVGGVKSNTATYTIGTSSNNSASGVSSASSKQQPDNDKPKYIGKGDNNLFLRANVSSTTVYEQQAIVYTVKLYSTYSAIKFVGATAAPKFDGFVVEESKDISSSLSVETYQGKSYATAVIARYIIFPQMTGNLKISGNTYTVSVDQREYYHDPFWGNMSYSSPLQLNVTPNDLVVNVRALPAPKPADFCGGVGKFSLSSHLKQSEFKTNQAAQIEYVVSGTGNIKYVQLPDLSTIYPSELEVYTPNSKQSINVGSSSVSGSVNFDYSFMPLEEGQFIIPEIKLVYFNPETGKYETSVAKGYTIKVGKGNQSASSANAGNLRFDQSLQSVKSSDLQKYRIPYIKNVGYWLCYIIPMLILVAISLYWRWYSSQHSDMAAFNSKRADKIARKRLRKANDAMKKGLSDLFYDELLIALWGYLGDKLKMPTSELMRDNIRNVLEQRNIPNNVIDNLIQIIDNAEFAKYSSAGSKDGLEKAYQSVVDIINNLENAFKKS